MDGWTSTRRFEDRCRVLGLACPVELMDLVDEMFAQPLADMTKQRDHYQDRCDRISDALNDF